MSKPDSALKEVYGRKIFVRWPLKINNLMHFRSIVHELKIKDITALLRRLHLQQAHDSLSAAWLLLVHED